MVLKPLTPASNSHNRTIDLMLLDVTFLLLFLVQFDRDTAKETKVLVENNKVRDHQTVSHHATLCIMMVSDLIVTLRWLSITTIERLKDIRNLHGCTLASTLA